MHLPDEAMIASIEYLFENCQSVKGFKLDSESHSLAGHADLIIT